jgi:putative membrane protein
MLYQHTVYDHGHWMQHHSSARYAKHLLSVAFSQVILAFGSPVMSLTAIAAAVTGYSEPVLAHAVPQFFPLLHVSSLPFSLSTPALALSLVFHTNTCYGRFNKGMKAWDSIVNRTRDIFRPALTWMQSPGDVHKVHCFLSYAVAISYFLKDHVT